MNVELDRWKKLTARKIDQKTHGRTQRAYRRRDGALLLLHRPQSRNAGMYSWIACWVLVFDDCVVKRQLIYGRRPGAAPIRWANKWLRQFQTGHEGTACHLLDGRRPSIAESIRQRPVQPDELPPTLIGKCLSGRSVQKTSIEVPATLLFAPPQRTTDAAYRDTVLSIDEYNLFIEQWTALVNAYPRYTSEEFLDHFRRMCLSEVFMCRLHQLRFHGIIREARFLRLYHWASRRRQKGRDFIFAELAAIAKKRANATCGEWHPLFFGWRDTG